MRRRYEIVQKYSGIIPRDVIIAEARVPPISAPGITASNDNSKVQIKATQQFHCFDVL